MTQHRTMKRIKLAALITVSCVLLIFAIELVLPGLVNARHGSLPDCGSEATALQTSRDFVVTNLIAPALVEVNEQASVSHPTIKRRGELQSCLYAVSSSLLARDSLQDVRSYPFSSEVQVANGEYVVSSFQLHQ